MMNLSAGTIMTEQDQLRVRPNFNGGDSRSILHCTRIVQRRIVQLHLELGFI